MNKFIFRNYLINIVNHFGQKLKKLVNFMNKKLIILYLILSICVLFSLFTYKIEPDTEYTNKEIPNGENHGYKKKYPLLSDPTQLWFEDLQYTIKSVSISSDGNYIAAASANGMIYLFDKSHTLLWSRDLSISIYGNIESIAISSDGNYIVVGTAREVNPEPGVTLKNWVYLFHKSSNSIVRKYEMSDKVLAVAICSNGDYFVAGTEDNNLHLFDRSISSSPDWTYSADGPVRDVDISSNSIFIAAAMGDYVYTFNRANPAYWRKYNIGVSVETVAISSDTLYIVAGAGNKVHFTHRDDYSPIWEYTTGGKVNSVSISSNGKYFVAGSNDNKVYLFRRSSLTQATFEWSYNTGTNVYSVTISSDGNFILAQNSNPDHKTYQFHISDSTPIWDYTTSGTSYKFSVAISSDGTYNVAGDNDGFLFLFKDDHKPYSFNLYHDTVNPDDDGYFNLIWTNSKRADTYSIYTSDHYFTKIEQDVTLVESGLTDITYPINDWVSGNYYFRVFAFNSYGNTSSECINVIVERKPGPFTITTKSTIINENVGFYVNWTTSTDANNYSLYVSRDTISEINGQCELIQKDLTNSSYLISGLEKGIYYYAAVANNDNGYTISNCLKVDVRIPSLPADGDSDSGNDDDDDDDNDNDTYGIIIVIAIAAVGGAVGTIGILYFLKKKTR